VTAGDVRRRINERLEELYRRHLPLDEDVFASEDALLGPAESREDA
jgi:hypothetical protein